MGKKGKNEFFVRMEVTASKYEMLNYSPLAFTDLIEERIAELGVAIRNQFVDEYNAQNRRVKANGSK